MSIKRFFNFFKKDEIEDWQYYHELGHGIIAFIFDGYIYNFKGITFDKSDLQKANLHVDDKGYTIVQCVNNFNDFVSENNLNTAFVDGLYLISGSAGAYFWGFSADLNDNHILPCNWNKIINDTGAIGDLDIMKKAEKPFGWLMDKKEIAEQKRVFIYCKLYEILQDLFTTPEIRNSISKLFKKLKKSKRLSPEDFRYNYGNTLEKLRCKLLNDNPIDIWLQ